MSVELAIQTMTDVARSLELAQWAESAGLAAFAVADHYLTSERDFRALDQITVLAAVAARTEAIELATLVSPITFRHPAVLLKAGVTIDEISGGRFTLGLGAGWMEKEHEVFGFDFPATRERLDRLEEALGYIASVREGSESGFHGRHYHLAPGPTPLPRGERMRLAVGGSGPRRTPELAGTYADEFNVFPSRHPMDARITAARRAAVDAVRDPDTILFSTAFPLVVGEDRADLDRRIDQVAAARGTEPDRIRTSWPRAGIPVATRDEYLERLAELEALGISRVYFQVGFDSPDDIRRSIGLLVS
ncbi:MAG TPA: LLM class flavin-dependent oxidoreductase [Acidimicrobiia bacterium]